LTPSFCDAILESSHSQEFNICRPDSSLNVSLTPELEKFVQGRVASGRYQTASEVVREGLRLLERQEMDREEAFAALKKKLQRAAAAVGGAAKASMARNSSRNFGNVLRASGRKRAR